MGYIENYPLDKEITGNELALSTDLDGKTVNVPVSKILEYVETNSTISGIEISLIDLGESNSNIVDLLNSIPQFNITKNEMPLFKVKVPPNDINFLYLLKKGPGTYGLGGTTLTTDDIVLLEKDFKEIDIDNTMSDSSINPVQNKIVKAYIDNIDHIPNSEKGVANGVATLDGAGLIPNTQLPSYIDDIQDFDTKADFPPIGQQGIIYFAKDTLTQYRWVPGSNSYEEIIKGAVQSVFGRKDNIIAQEGDYAAFYAKLKDLCIINIEENNNKGCRRADQDANNHGNIGNFAVDLSNSDSISSSYGATGEDSFACNYKTESKGDNSFACNSNTFAGGLDSFAEGYNTKATGRYTHTSGYGTEANYDYQFVVGKNNKNNSLNLFEIGNGPGTSIKQNAFEVDTSGNVNIPSDAEYRINGKNILIVVEYEAKNYDEFKSAVQTINASGKFGRIIQTGDWVVNDTTIHNLTNIEVIYKSGSIIVDSNPLQIKGIAKFGGNTFRRSQNISPAITENITAIIYYYNGNAIDFDNCQFKYIFDEIQAAIPTVPNIILRPENSSDVRSVAINFRGCLNTTVNDVNIPRYMPDRGLYIKKEGIPTSTRNDLIHIENQYINKYASGIVSNNHYYIEYEDTRLDEHNIQLDNSAIVTSNIANINTKIYVNQNLFNIDNVTQGEVKSPLPSERNTRYSLRGDGSWQEISKGGLIQITEGGNTGYRRADYNPDNYGNIGDGAVDLSYSGYASTTRGATGQYSFAEGGGTSQDRYSHAEGSSTAKSNYSHAEGNATDCYGEGSHTEGAFTSTGSNYAHAEGYGSAANAQYSHAEGYRTKSNASSSHAEGNTTEATGSASHSEGTYTKAIGDYSHAEGRETTASGNYGHSEGFSTTASGLASHSQNLQTIAAYNSQTAIGKFNNNKADTLFEIGNGTGSNARSNAFEVDTSGNVNIPDGAEYRVNGVKLAGGGTEVITEQGVIQPQTGIRKVGADPNNYGTIGSDAVDLSTSTSASSTYGATGAWSTAIGHNTTASSSSTFASGYRSIASGQYAQALGYYASATGGYSIAIGRSINAGYQYQTVFGKYNDNKADTLLEIGNGLGNTARSNALEIDNVGNVNISSGAQYKINGTPYPQPSNIVTIPNTQTITGEKIFKHPNYWSMTVDRPGTANINTNIKFLQNGGNDHFLGYGSDGELRWGTNHTATANGKVYTSNNANKSTIDWETQKLRTTFGSNSEYSAIIRNSGGEALGLQIHGGSGGGDAKLLSLRNNIADNILNIRDNGAIQITQPGAPSIDYINIKRNGSQELFSINGSGQIDITSYATDALKANGNISTEGSIITDRIKNRVSSSIIVQVGSSNIAEFGTNIVNIQGDIHANNISNMAGKNFWSGTQADYDKIGSHDSNTIYFINE